MIIRTSILLGVCLFGAACGQSSPSGPSATAQPAPSGPRILLAGQSNAFFLQPYLPDAIAITNIDGSIDYWLMSRDFAQASMGQIVALVWWQGGADVALTTDQYATKLRSLIDIARSSNRNLPIRIVELVDFPIRANVRAAQRLVAGDPGVELIPTADLPLDSDGNHYTPAGYQTVRDRINRSLVR